MSLRAAAIEVDITPPVLPIEKPGWIVKILADQVEDPICAKIVVIEWGGTRVGFISLDVLSVRWPLADRIRAIAATLGIPKTNLMVAATHVHTGPAVSSPGLARRDERYVEFLIERVGEGLKRAVESLQPARLAIGSALEARVSFIRRCIMKDGTTRTHPPPTATIRCPESVIDPEVGLIAIEELSGGKTLGMIVNFALHPVHGGGGTALSAGWPGQMAMAIKQSIGPNCVTCFLNGALGDVHHQPTIVPDAVDTKEHVGRTVAETVTKSLPGLSRADDLSLAAAAETIRISIRDIDGPYGINMKGRQRFAPDDVYETLIARLRAKKARRDHVLAEVQAIRLSKETALVSLPCEPFSGIGLAIKRQSAFANTYVVGCANGMIGYVPTREAFDRGGYEATLSMGSKLDPAAAEMLITTALRLLVQLRQQAKS